MPLEPKKAKRRFHILPQIGSVEARAKTPTRLPHRQTKTNGLGLAAANVTHCANRTVDRKLRLSSPPPFPTPATSTPVGLPGELRSPLSVEKPASGIDDHPSQCLLGVRVAVFTMSRTLGFRTCWFLMPC